jgi:hypothetical protein
VEAIETNRGKGDNGHTLINGHCRWIVVHVIYMMSWLGSSAPIPFFFSTGEMK